MHGRLFYDLRMSRRVVGVGTIITAFFMGPLVDLFARKLAKPFLYGKNKPEANTET